MGLDLRCQILKEVKVKVHFVFSTMTQALPNYVLSKLEQCPHFEHMVQSYHGTCRIGVCLELRAIQRLAIALLNGLKIGVQLKRASP